MSGKRELFMLKQCWNKLRNKRLLLGCWLVICLLACLVLGFSLFGLGVKQALAQDDTTPPPVPGLSSPADGGFTNTPYPNLSWSDVYDPSGVTYNLQVDDDSNFSSPEVDRTNLSSTSDTVTTPLDEGRYYWKVKAVDGADNESAWSDTWFFTVDITPPSAPSLVSPANNALTNDSNPTFDWSDVTDPSGVTYWLQVANDTYFYNMVEERQWMPDSQYTMTWDLWDQTYYWRVKAVDGAGNESDWSAVWNFTIDTTPPPSPELEFPPNDAWINNPVPNFNWSDVTGATSYTLEIRYGGSVVLSKTGLTSSEYTLTADEALTTEGEYWWRVAAVDAAGNEGWSGDWRFDLDTTPPPVPTLNSPNNDAKINTATPYFEWQEVSDRHTFTLQIDNDADLSSPEVDRQNINQPDYNLSPGEALTEGTYYWQVRAVDQAGNESNWSSSWSFTVDTIEPPVPSLVSPTDGALTSNQRPMFDWEDVTDPSGVTYWLQIARDVYFFGMEEERSWISNSQYTMPWDLGDSTFYWRVKAVDMAGNESDWSNPTWSFTVDASRPPNPNLISPHDGMWTSNTTPSFDWEDVTDFSGVTYVLVIDNNHDFTSPELTKPELTASEYTLASEEALADGEYFWRVKAIDGAGNESDWWEWHFTVDISPPPPPSLNDPPEGQMIDHTTPGFGWQGVDDPSGRNFTLQIDNNKDFSSPELVRWDIGGPGYGLSGGEELTEGTWYWRVRAVDEVGNEGSWSEVWEFTVQLMKATNITIEVPDGFIVEGGKIFIATLSDANGRPIPGEWIRWETDFGEFRPWDGTTDDKGQFGSEFWFPDVNHEREVWVKVRFGGSPSYHSSEAEVWGKAVPKGWVPGEPGKPEPGEPGEFELGTVMPPIIVVVGVVGGIFFLFRRRRRAAAVRIGYERKLEEWKAAGFDTSELEERLKKK